MNKKLVLKFAISNKNILMRFKKEQKKNPEFTLRDMAEMFGVVSAHGELQRGVVWKWMRSGSYSRLPNRTIKCPECGKTQHDNVSEWLNDGSLMVKK